MYRIPPIKRVISTQSLVVWCALVVGCFAIFGCASARFNLADSVRPEDARPASEVRQANFLSGFGQQHTIDAVKVCGSLDKVASVEVEQSLIDAVIATVTLGIYTPLSARVYCK
jgi:Bor protein